MSTVRIVVCGSGAVREKNALALMRDYLTGWDLSMVTLVCVGNTQITEFASRLGEADAIKVENHQDFRSAGKAKAILVAWNDEDPASYEIARYAGLMKCTPLDVCQGLLPLEMNATATVEAPIIPEAEQVPEEPEIASSVDVEALAEDLDEFIDDIVDDVMDVIRERVIEAVYTALGRKKP